MTSNLSANFHGERLVLSMRALLDHSSAGRLTELAQKLHIAEETVRRQSRMMTSHVKYVLHELHTKLASSESWQHEHLLGIFFGNKSWTVQVGGFPTDVPLVARLDMWMARTKNDRQEDGISGVLN